jgi:hypothetical protein
VGESAGVETKELIDDRNFVKARIQAVLWAQRHLLAAILIAFACGSVLTLLWVAYEHYQFRQLKQTHEYTLEGKKSLIQDKAALTVEVSILKAGNENLRKSMQQQELRLHEQERAIDFYKQLMDPASVKKGLVLSSYRITDLGENRYQLTWVFVQYAKRRSLMRADLQIELNGTVNGAAQRLNLAALQLAAEDKKQQSLSFRYYQALEQVIELPKGFTPSSIALRAKIKNKKTTEWQQDVPWFIEEI